MSHDIPEKTVGEKIVRTEFNPSKNDLVDQIKQKTAELINLVKSLENQSFYIEADPDEHWLVLQQRQKAVDAYEVAAMHAVKAATSTLYKK